MGIWQRRARRHRARAAVAALVAASSMATAAPLTAGADHERGHEFVYMSRYGDARPRPVPEGAGRALPDRMFDVQIRWEPRNRRVWVGSSKGLMVFDARGRPLSTISGIQTASEFLVDPKRGRVLVPDSERSELVVVDTTTLEVTRRWPFFPGGGDGVSEPGSALCTGRWIGYQKGLVWFSHASDPDPERCGAREDYTGVLDPDDGRAVHHVPVTGLRGDAPPNAMSSPMYRAVPRSRDLVVQTTHGANPHMYRMRATGLPSPSLTVQAETSVADRAHAMAVDPDGSHVMLPSNTGDHYRRRVSDLAPSRFEARWVKEAASFAPDGRLAVGSTATYGGDPRVLNRNEKHPFRRFDFGDPHYTPHPNLEIGGLALGDRKLYAVTDGDGIFDRRLYVMHVGLQTRVNAGRDWRRSRAGDRVPIRVRVKPPARRRVVIFKVRDDARLAVVRRGRTDARGRLTRTVRTWKSRNFLVRVVGKGPRGPGSDRVRVVVRR